MLAAFESRTNKGVTHISGFYGDTNSKNLNNKQMASQLKKFVEVYKHTLIQITLREDQIREYPLAMREMYTLGFVPVFRHINPNTNRVIRMFLRKPDLPEGFQAETLDEWKVLENEDPMAQMKDLIYHAGGCCGYTDVRGFTIDRQLARYEGYDSTRDYNKSKQQTSILRTMVSIKGEMDLFFRPGMAYQMFMPKGFILTNHYFTGYLDQYIKKMGFAKEYSYLCPTNKTEMCLYMASTNKQAKETWVEISARFKLGIFKTGKEKTPVNTKGPLRDEYGRFASRSIGLGLGTVDMVAATPTADFF